MDPLAPRSVSRHTTTTRGPRIPESHQPGSGHAPPEVPKGGGRRETGTGKCSRRIRACDLTRPTRNNLASARLFAARSLLHRPALTMGRITTPGRGEAVISSSGGASSTPAPQLGNGDDEVDYAGAPDHRRTSALLSTAPWRRVRVVRRETRQTRLQGLVSRLPQRGRLAKEPPPSPRRHPSVLPDRAAMALGNCRDGGQVKVSTAAARWVLRAGCCTAVQISLPILPGSCSVLRSRPVSST